MNLKFQYNKIAQLQLEKQLKIRQKALPTLKNKESALRMEVKRARDSALELDGKIKSRINELEPIMKLWAEFDPSLIKVENVEFLARKIAGVPVPILGNIQFEISEYDLFSTPSWYLDGIEMIKEIAAMRIEREFFWRKMLILEQVRKKTTQKVNLYEKSKFLSMRMPSEKLSCFLKMKKIFPKLLKNSENSY